MKVVVAPDSFKGSLTAVRAAQAMARGVLHAAPEADVVELPVADGGEGTLDAVLQSGGQHLHTEVTGPDGIAVKAAYGLLPGSQTAVIEMAQAAGLALAPAVGRDPRYATTYGVGELLLAALGTGASTLVVGLGGSCTNDGGAGAMQALGAKFLDASGEEIGKYIAGADLIRIARVDMSEFRFPAGQVTVIAASDVTNPLTGPLGASAVYGPQKGATPESVIELDRALANYASVVRRDIGVDIDDVPGAGAAGGLGASLIGLLNAEVRSGIDLVLDLVNFNQQAADADFVLTGEGRIDIQTISGKVIMGLLARCNSLRVPLIAFGGSVDESAEVELLSRGLLAAIPIVSKCMPLTDAMASAEALIETAAARAMRLLLCPRTRPGSGSTL